MKRCFSHFYFIVPLLLFITSCSQDAGNNSGTEKKDSLPKDIDALNARILQDPNNADLYHQRSKMYIEKKDLDAASADLGRAFKIDNERSEFYVTQANIYFIKNETGKAKSSFEKAVSLDSSNAEALMKLAELHFYVKQYSPSIEYVNRVLKINQYNAKAYFLKGMNFKEMGDTTRAISSMITAVEQDQDYYAAYMQLGILHAGIKNGLAEKYYDNALRLQPNSIEALYGKGKFYQDMENVEKAREQYDALLKISPNYPYAHFNLGVINLHRKNYATALINFDSAIKSDSKYMDAYFGRATCYEQLGNKKAAIADYNIVLQLNPEHEGAKQSLNRL